MQANDAARTQHNGSYEIHGSQLVLRQSDGSKYQDWHAEISDDGRNLQVNDKKLFETYIKVEDDAP